MKAAGPQPRVFLLTGCLIAEALRIVVLRHDEFLGVQAVWSVVNLLLLVRVWRGAPVARFALAGTDIVVAVLTGLGVVTVGREAVDRPLLLVAVLALTQAALLLTPALGRRGAALPATRPART